MLKVRVSEPPVPWAWKLVGARRRRARHRTVSALLALPLAGGVTGSGTKLQVTPAGRPVQDRLTALVKPFCEVTVQVLVPLPPCGDGQARRAAGEREVRGGVPAAASR